MKMLLILIGSLGIWVNQNYPSPIDIVNCYQARNVDCVLNNVDLPFVMPNYFAKLEDTVTVRDIDTLRRYMSQIVNIHHSASESEIVKVDSLTLLIYDRVFSYENELESETTIIFKFRYRNSKWTERSKIPLLIGVK